MKLFIDKKLNKIINQTDVDKTKIKLPGANSFISQSTISKTKKGKFLE